MEVLTNVKKIEIIQGDGSILYKTIYESAPCETPQAKEESLHAIMGYFYQQLPLLMCGPLLMENMVVKFVGNKWIFTLTSQQKD